MLRRLHHEQPESFAFTQANHAWAEAQISKYPPGRQASAIIPLLWRAQEQEGWLSRPAIEHVADMLGMAHIRALEVATFYFMFQLQPVGSVAHIQVCGTTSCMICGAEDLVAVCRDKIADRPHQLSDDGKFSWEEVECLGACANAPMAQIGKDYYEDLTAEKLGWILDELAAGRVPPPGPQNGRFASEPASGLTSLDGEGPDEKHNGSVALALALEDSVRRIDGSEVALTTPWLRQPEAPKAPEGGKPEEPRPAADKPVDATGVHEQEARARAKAKPEAAPPVPPLVAPDDSADEPAEAGTEGESRAPALMTKPEGKPDDLQRISGIGPKLEQKLNAMGVWHYRQIAAWGPKEVAWMDDQLNFKGRIDRDEWIAQAGELAGAGAIGTTKGQAGDKAGS